MKAIIPAAGLGSRFLPGTKAVPKELLLVVDRPAIQYVVEECIAAAADEVIIVNSPGKAAIEKHFSPDPALTASLREKGKHKLADMVEQAGAYSVSYVYQKEPLGLGHAVLCAKNACEGERFYVLLGDVLVPENSILPSMKRISDAHGGASVIAVVPVKDEEVSRFGIIDGVEIEEGVWKLSSLVEKPSLEEAPTHLAVFGRYLLSPRTMELLEEVKPGVGGEIQLTDALVALLGEQDMYAYVIDPSEGFDTGTIDAWIETNNVLYGRKKQAGLL